MRAISDVPRTSTGVCGLANPGTVALVRSSSRRLFLGTLVLSTFALSGPSFGDALDDAASAAYQNVRTEAVRRDALITVGADYDRVERITNRLIAVAPEMRPGAENWAWDVTYIRSPKVNAFCLPGGKMIVTSSLVERLALTDDELAAVVGHEMGHALLEHGRESYAQHQVARAAVGVLGIIAAIAGAKHHTDPSLAFNATTAVGSLGAEFFVLRPYSRERELEADKFGAELAARAGFDPTAAITLQQKLATNGTVEFLSTHPASETRVQQLAQVVPSLTQRFAARRESTNVASSAAPAVPAAGPPPEVEGGALSHGLRESTTSTDHRQATALAATVDTVPVTTPANDPDAVTGAAAASMTSKYMFSAERYAKGRGCALPTSTMTIRAPSYESFDIRCSNGSRLMVRCDGGSCVSPQ